MAGNNLIIQFHMLFLTVASAAFVVTIYHCIVLLWRNRQQRNNPQSPQATEARFENSITELIPRRKYEKGNTFLDIECAVCLCEFEEGEDVRTLSECMHSFHVPCIDTWLRSHPNCPVCRASAPPMAPPQVWYPPSRIDDVESQRQVLGLSLGLGRESRGL